MNLKYFIKYQLLLRHCHINQNSRGLVLPYGLGDTYLICSLIAKYRQRYSIDSLVLLVKPSHQLVVKMFDLSVKTIVTNNMEEVIKICELYGKNRNGHVHIAHPNYMKESNLASFIGYKDINLVDMYKIMLSLPPDTNMQLPRSPKKMHESNFAKLGLVKHKSIILFPEANSIDLVRKEFWEEIARFYTRLGYNVFSSVAQSVNLVAGTIPVTIAISQIREVVAYAGYVISLRSGICEVMSTSKAKMMIIYPDRQWYSGSFIAGSSLVKMQLNLNITEIVVQENMKISNLQLKSFVHD